MKGVQEALVEALREPTPEALTALQGALLANGRRNPAVERALALAGQFHAYLCELRSKLSAREYSEVASRLDIGAVGLVALENLVTGEGKQLWERLLLGGLGETAMVAASRQYVKAWQAEATTVHRCAAWNLAEALWHLSCEMQPDLPAEERWAAIQSLLAPAHDPLVRPEVKGLLLGRLFQSLVAFYALRMLQEA